MTINTLADYAVAAKQYPYFQKPPLPIYSGSRWLSASAQQIAGVPVQIPAVNSPITGLIPVNGDVGFPLLAPFAGTGYLTSLELGADGSNLQGFGVRIILYDRLYHAGQFSASSGVVATLSGQPSFASRIPGGTD